MECSVYYDKSAEHIIRQYCRKLRIRNILAMLLVCVDAIMFYCIMEMAGHRLGGILILPIYLLSLYLLWIGVRFFNYMVFMGLSKILYYDCDPAKYQEVLNGLLVLDKRGRARAAISLELAAAALAQGKGEEGASYLEQATFKKVVLFRELKKLGCYADYLDLHDDFIGLHRIEEELYELKANVKAGDCLYQEIEHEISVVQAMASREHEVISSQRERWVMLYSAARNPLQENLYLMRLAKLELAQGKRELSIRYMGFVAAEGNTLSCAAEAMGILRMQEMAGSACALEN